MKIVPLLCVTALLTAAAQTIYTGELTGTVADPSGKVIVGAKVDVTSGATGEKSSAASDSAGEFRFPLLRPGPYLLAVGATGFELKTLMTTVELGQSSNLPIQLGIETKRDYAVVTGEAPLLQSNNGNLATTFNQQEIDNLPLPGGDLTVYAFTTPGVTLSSAMGSGNFSAFGLPSISNLFTLNGMDYNNTYYGTNNFGASNLMLGANEIQEAAVVVNGYSGQYGRQAGANVNYLTKSGSNAFHGNASWQYNEQMLNANDWFNNVTGTLRPFSISNAWAASLGGPIRKNKLFFFVDNEGLRYVLPNGGPVYIPTPEFGDFVLAHLAATNPTAVPLYTTAFKLYAGASGASRTTPVTAALDPALGCGDLVDEVYGVAKPCAEAFQNTVNSLFTESLTAARVDYHATANDRMYLRLTLDRGVQAASTDPINPAFNANNPVPLDSGQFGYTKVISENSVNSMLISANYTSDLYGPQNLSTALQTFPTTFLFNDGLYTNLGGYDNSYPQGMKMRTWQLVDDYSFIRGRHSFKAGVNVRKNFLSSYFYGQLTSGLVTFNSMTDFVNGSLVNGSTYAQAFATFGAEFETFYSAGFYAQDEWRVRPNLVVTLALRFDRNSNIGCYRCFTSLANQESFDQLAHSAAIPYNQAIATGLNTASRGVDAITPEPRLGIAYNLTRSTVLRGGVGLFSDPTPGFVYDRLLTNAPAVSLFTTDSGLVATNTPNSAFLAVAASNAALQHGFAGGATLAQLQAQVPGFSPPNFFTFPQHLVNTRFAEWNVELQHAFGDRYLLSVNYVGNHGFDEYVQDLLANAYSSAGLAGLPTSAPDPRFNEVDALNYDGRSNYAGLAASFRWRMNAQFSGQFSYTWSHALDDCSNNCTPLTFGGASLRFQLSPILQSLNYSNSDYDVRHTLNARYIYTMPAAHFHNSILMAAVGGWTAAGTVFFNTGYPFSMIDTGVLGKFGGIVGKLAQPILADFLGGPSYPGCTVPNVACYARSQFATGAAQNDFGNIPRNSFRGPHYFDTDLNISKAFTFAGKYSVRIGASFFNILNHPNFGLPVNNVASGAFGRIQSTVEGPTSPYGEEAGAAVSGRVIQTSIRFSF